MSERKYQIKLKLNAEQPVPHKCIGGIVKYGWDASSPRAKCEYVCNKGGDCMVGNIISPTANRIVRMVAKFETLSGRKYELTESFYPGDASNDFVSWDVIAIDKNPNLPFGEAEEPDAAK